MTYQEALDYIWSVSPRGSRPGLERISALMEKLGNVQDKLKFVHIAGTNGKGSTSCMLSGILTAAGYKTGLFISPHIIRFNERMQINGVPVADEDLAAVITKVKAAADTMGDGATEFEIMMAAGFVWFAQQRCDIVVLETGLGGRLDATNLITTNECAVLTNIGIDHTDYLGNTLAQIAYEKACILKPGRPAAVYTGDAEAMDVVTDYAARHGNKLRMTDFSAIESLSADLSGQDFRYKNSPIYHISLLGAHQLRNAALVLETVELLRGLGWKLKNEHISAGLRNARWPARFELLQHEPIVIVDGAHNLQGVTSLCEAVATYLPDQRIVCLTGVLEDKDWQPMMNLLRGFATEFVTVTPDSPRALSGHRLAAWLRDKGCVAHGADTIPSGVRYALARAKATDSALVACGSLYMAAEIREYFGLQ